MAKRQYLQKKVQDNTARVLVGITGKLYQNKTCIEGC